MQIQCYPRDQFLLLSYPLRRLRLNNGLQSLKRQFSVDVRRAAERVWDWPTEQTDGFNFFGDGELQRGGMILLLLRHSLIFKR